jgi:hypothetical protein
LNGENYDYCGNTIRFNGLRPYICWKFLALYTTEGSVKHSDTGNFTILPEQRPNQADLNYAKSTRLENSMREYNRISDYLTENNDDFPLWESKGTENITNLEMIII